MTKNIHRRIFPPFAGNSLGVVEGSYSYVDGHGLPQRVDYVADALGFRASGTNVNVNGAHLGAVGASGYATAAYGRPVASPVVLRRHRRSVAAPYAAAAAYPTLVR